MHKRLEEIDQLIERWIQQLDVIIPQLLAKLDTDIKQDRFDLVTNVDKALQQHFSEMLHEHLPGHQLVAEEKNNDTISAHEGHVWLLDPIDGTANLVKQQEDYCIIIGYFVNGKPKLSYIYDYVHQKLYKAIEHRGAFENNNPLPKPPILSLQDAMISFDAQYIPVDVSKALREACFANRNIGSCGLDSIKVIKGQFGAYINTNPKPWDIAAQHLFAKELGLKMTCLTRAALNISEAGPFIISNEGCYDEIINIYQCYS
ncbi:inositol monophosphatase family protein [Staphylococcus lugdunensis]|uniref:inositol monophosphatase family protein n=1 Tax=Staphylococcus lugdunensis TaxID=28035 RepID=UPI000A195A37|nr:inositol monophosphatase family protein [Staphylococcus lugdunensis]ARJ18208.1 inositol monophosphatase [Staphylococcus lugdunensis]